MARPRNTSNIRTTKKQQKQQQQQQNDDAEASRSNSISEQSTSPGEAVVNEPVMDESSTPKAEESQDPNEIAWRNGTNADIAAMRATLTLLQMQRLQAQRDIRLLEDQKAKATAQPEAYARALHSGRLDSVSADMNMGLDGDDSNDDHETDKMDEDAKTENATAMKDGFRRLPRRQDIAGCPRINWEKYGIDGATLDRIHREQLNGQN